MTKQGQEPAGQGQPQQPAQDYNRWQGKPGDPTLPKSPELRELILFPRYALYQQIEALEAANAGLRQTIDDQARRIAELEQQVAQPATTPDRTIVLKDNCD